jgi:4-diphosphocytidyl-2-C-methyl-D-erythritol kinase
MTILRALAPGKTNLCLFVGPTRPDGLHALVSLIEPLSLADELTLEPLPSGAGVAAVVGVGDAGCAAGADEVVCAGVEGPNLAATALAAYRAASGWDGPPQRLTIVKRVPVAAGMGGGSGDAAATLRLIAHAARSRGGGHGEPVSVPSPEAAGPPADALIAQLAPQLGADVPSQLEPGLVLVGGAGEYVEPAAPRAPHGVLVLPSKHRLSTPDVFREADRLGSTRSNAALEQRRAALVAALAAGPELAPELIVNDLEAAARSLCPSIDDALAAARAAGADHALVSGSGPTVVGIFWGAAGATAAVDAAAALEGDFPGAVGTRPVEASFAAVRAVRDNDCS